jgi:hypothetical protein
MFEVMHAKSTAMGHIVQAITGILWFYRQFGYEYAIELGGGRDIPLALVPVLKDGEPERFRLRPMTSDDFPFVMPLFERGTQRSLVTCPRPEWLWQLFLSGYSSKSFETRSFRIVENGAGRPVGYVAATRELGYRSYAPIEMEFLESESIRAIAPSMLRGLKEMAQEEAAVQKKEVSSLFFKLGRVHPVFDAIPDYFTRTLPPYGWYVRVPDMIAYLRRIAPELENRLARSPLAGHSGELKIDEFVRGTRLEFEHGKLVQIEPLEKIGGAEGNVYFPPYTFTQLVFGFRGLADLRAAYPDCYAGDESAILLNALFPRRASCVIPVG